MIEYQINYTVGGIGFSDSEPWVEIKTDDKKEARNSYDDLVEYLSAHYEVSEAWVETREVSSWQRVDPAILT